MNLGTRHKLWFGFVAVSLLSALLIVPSGTSQAAVSPPPSPPNLPSTVDWLPEYHGYQLCSNYAKPGTKKLMNLLDRTYGKYTKYTTRACAGGMEHAEGRAIDWMVNSRNASQRAKANSMIKWLLAKGPNGETAANARRLGILYLVWNNAIWGVYRANEGWREISGCRAKAKAGKQYDTSCHRDHIHFSLTWDGANAQTSYWTGKPELRGPCSSSSVSRPGGSSRKARVLIDTQLGTGLNAKKCRLAGHTRYTNRSYSVKVPRPALPASTAVYQKIRIDRMQNNAPTGLKIISAKTVTVGHTAKLPKVVHVPLRQDGKITLKLAAGYASVRAVGVGQSKSAPAPTPTPTPAPAKPTAKVSTDRSWTVTNRRFTMNAKVGSIPRGTVLKSQVNNGRVWSNLATRLATNGNHNFTIRSPQRPGKYRYQAVVHKDGKLVTASNRVDMSIKPARVHVAIIPKSAKVGSKVRLKVKVYGGPSGATAYDYDIVSGRHYLINKRKITNGTYYVDVPLQRSGAHILVVKMRTADNKYISRSQKRGITVR